MERKRKGNRINVTVKDYCIVLGFPGGPVVKNLPANAGHARDPCSELGRSPRVENGNPFQNSCLGNSMDRGDCQTTVHGSSESEMTKDAVYMHCCVLFNLLLHPLKSLIKYEISEIVVVRGSFPCNYDKIKLCI